MTENYAYQKREVTLDPERQIRLGEGKISAYLSVFLGAISVLSVLCYLFPQYLTTQELRAAYDPVFLQKLLKYVMYFSLFFGVLTFFFSKRQYKVMGSVGILLTLIAFGLGGYSVPMTGVKAQRLSLGLDWMILAFLGSAVIFTTLEKCFPKYKEQVILREGWGTDLFYFCFNHLMISAILIYANYHVSHFDWALNANVHDWIQSTPVWLQVVLIILAADFVLYWEHRAYHEIKLLWPIHAVHHSVETLDWLAGSRGHFIQVFLERAMVMVPLYVLGFEQAALNVYVTFAALQAVLIHTNCGLSFGPLKYIFVTPQFHHWHHSSEQPAIDTNYSAHTVVFDYLFNTYHMPDAHWPADYGTVSPLPKSVLGQTLYPFKLNRD